MTKHPSDQTDPKISIVVESQTLSVDSIPTVPSGAPVTDTVAELARTRQRLEAVRAELERQIYRQAQAERACAEAREQAVRDAKWASQATDEREAAEEALRTQAARVSTLELLVAARDEQLDKLRRSIDTSAQADMQRLRGQMIDLERELGRKTVALQNCTTQLQEIQEKYFALISHDAQRTAAYTAVDAGGTP